MVKLATLASLAVTVLCAPAPIEAVKDVIARDAAESTANIPAFAYSKAAASVHDLVGSMQLDDDGFVHYADDGVVRSYAANGTVIDYVKLSNAQLSATVNSLPPSIQHEQEHYADVFKNVNGHDIIDDAHIYNPPAGLRPLDSDFSNDGKAQSVNEKHEVAKQLASRQSYAAFSGLYCIGAACTNSASCVLMGCATCALMDQTYGQKICW